MAVLEAEFVGSLGGRVALVTGASRGLGKGIARMLCEAGATVYITGRSMDTGDFPLRGAAKDISQKGGKCVPIECDHARDVEVKRLFKKIDQEQDGRLDILVNNAFAGVPNFHCPSAASSVQGSENSEKDKESFLMANIGKKFYEQPTEGWDIMNNVGTRSHYIAAHYAANMMIKKNSGLIVNISSAAGLTYLFSVPYGVGKETNDRMAADMAVELRNSNVCVVSLWPGGVITELIGEKIKQQGQNPLGEWKQPQDATLTGKAIVGLAVDKNIMAKTGKVLMVSELTDGYGMKDIGGKTPMSFRQVKTIVEAFYPGYGWMVPSFLYVPKWLFSFAGHKM